MIEMTVNGERHTLDVDPSMPLLYTLRNALALNGAKFGCGLGQCGACTVIVGDEAVFSCLLPGVVDVELIDRPGQPFLGVGEAAQGPMAAALANAIAHATGVRFKALPLSPARLRAALEARI